MVILNYNIKKTFDNSFFMNYNILATVARCIMQLDLREIINIPGGKVEFDYSPDLHGLETGSVTEIKPGARAVGSVRNVAGVLTFEAELSAITVCECARCLKVLDNPVKLSISATISDSDEVSEDPDMFYLEGNLVDVDEIIVNAFVLNTEQRFICSEDCKGLCPKCGADLNVAPCKCREEIDPRLAVLGQLLEND